MSRPDPASLSFHVLLVEDEPDDVFLAEHAFQKVAPEAKITVARTTAEAHEALQAERPDLVLLDVKLPGPDGLEFLGGVRSDARYDALPIVVLSTSAEGRDVQRAYELGANAYLVKPGEPQEMRDIIKGLRAFLSTRAGAPPLTG